MAKPTTPWFTVVDSCHGHKFILRITQMQRGTRTFYVEVHKTSPAYPSKTVRVDSRRTGFSAFQLACEALLKCSIKDPTTNPRVAKMVWNKASSVYPTRHQHATTIAMHLEPLFIHSRRGRGVVQAIGNAYQAYAHTSEGGRQSGYSGARVRKRKMLLGLTAQITGMIRDAETLLGGRSSAVGYTKTETAQIRDRLTTARVAIEDLRHRVFTNALVGHDNPLPASAADLLGAFIVDPTTTPPVPKMTEDDFESLAAQLP